MYARERELEKKSERSFWLLLCLIISSIYLYSLGDQQASLLMHAPTDIVMYMLMEELGLLSEISESTPEGIPNFLFFFLLRLRETRGEVGGLTCIFRISYC